MERQVLPIPDDGARAPLALNSLEVPVPPIRKLRPPSGAPNIVIVLLDDMGFGASSAFGGPCNMPVAQRLAGDGLRYTRFHTTAICSPTRACLLTGRNHHAVNMGIITGLATAMPGYTSVRPASAAPIAEILRLNGYSTGAFGKMHQTPTWEVSPAGPFDRWPTGEGFERFYGFLGGETDQYSPMLYDGTTAIDPPDTPGYHLSEDLTDQAITWIRTQQALAPDQPFFCYLSYGATHAPHHAPKEWIDRYRREFDNGWDRIRELTLARQKQLGVVPADCRLTRRHHDIPAWDNLSPEEQTVAARLMEAYAGFAEHTDAQVGRLVTALEEAGALENTLFLYVLGDNGASGEGGIHGTLNEIAALNGVEDTPSSMLQRLEEVGTANAYNHYPAGWAHAMNTPYQWTKQVASHWGGTRNGLIVHWPAKIAARGELRHQWHHVIDVMPTLLEVADLPIPRVVNGTVQQPVHGISMAYAFNDAEAPSRRISQYFEIMGNRGIYHDGWMACTKHATPWGQPTVPAFADDVWELYGPDDWSQAADLGGAMPQKLREMQELFLIEAARYGVFPLDDRRFERLNSEIAGRPDMLVGRTSMTLTNGMRHLPQGAVPNTKNKSHAITARVAVSTAGADGVIVAQGGRFGGWVLYMRDSVPTYCYNWLGLESYYVRGDRPVPTGTHQISFRFDYDGGGWGKGGRGALLVDEMEVARGRIERTVPFTYGIDRTMDVGRNGGTSVTPECHASHGSFTGSIESVTIEIAEPLSSLPGEAAYRIEVSTQ